MKKLKLFISLWFTMFSVAVFAQAEFEKIAITQNTLDNSAGRLIVQDATTGELKYILKSVLDNKFNQPTGNATQYLDGAGTPTAFPVLGQADRVITEVRNTTGSTVVKGTVVYLSGASGGKATIQKAQANSELTSSGTFGVIQSDINNNSNGYAVVIGTVLGVNTSSYTEGQVLWLSPTVAGGFTSTKPVAPNHAVYVAIVTLAATNGTIEVKVQNGYEIDELHDVLITSKTNNDAIVYDSASGLWKNKQLVADAIADGTTTVAPSQNAVFDALAAKENTSSKNVANGYAGLGSDGKLFSTQLPSITITDTFVVGSQAAMLALTAETGDVAVRTDVNKSFILKGSDPAVLANWQELLTPTSAVTSVFGRNGAVTAQNGDYTTALVTETTNKRYQTDIQQAYNDATSSIQSQLNAKEPSISAPGTTGSYWRGNKTFATLDTSVIPENGSLFFTNDRAKIAVTGNSGSINYVSKFTSNGTIGNSQIFDNGTNVGIGTASPSSIVHIVKGGGAKINFGDSKNTVAIGSVEETSDSAIGFFTQTTNERMRIASSGNVGIGTTSPSYKLEVSGTTDGVIGIRNTTNNSFRGLSFLDGSGSTEYSYIKYNANTGEMRYWANPTAFGGYTTFYSNAAESMRITANGNIGIGTQAPDAKFQVNGSDTDGLIQAYVTAGGGNALRINSNFVNGNYIDLNPYVSGVSNGGFEIKQNGTQRMIISETGNVGIGNTTPSEKLTVAGNIYTSGNLSTVDASGRIGFNVADNYGGLPHYGLGRIGGTNPLNLAGYYGLTFGTSGATRVTIDNGGATTFTSTVTATGFFQSSDLRLKDIVKRDGDVIYYKWKDARDAKLHIGYVAQEVQKENPEQVNTDDKGMLSVNYIEILVEKIRKLEKEIELLKAK